MSRASRKQNEPCSTFPWRICWTGVRLSRAFGPGGPAQACEWIATDRESGASGSAYPRYRILTGKIAFEEEEYRRESLDFGRIEVISLRSDRAATAVTQLLETDSYRETLHSSSGLRPENGKVRRDVSRDEPVLSIGSSEAPAECGTAERAGNRSPREAVQSRTDRPRRTMPDTRMNRPDRTAAVPEPHDR